MKRTPFFVFLCILLFCGAPFPRPLLCDADTSSKSVVLPGDAVRRPETGKTLEARAVPDRRSQRDAPLNLRTASMALIPQDVSAMLSIFNFYATCWDFNRDFCNPEGDFENRFQDNQDGTVTDMATSLMWQKSGSPEPVTWANAGAYLENANQKAFGGYSDWRLPTLEELASLMESSWKNSDLFIAPPFDKAQRACWTADTRNTNRIWKADFHMGFFMDVPMAEKNSARLVRSLP